MKKLGVAIFTFLFLSLPLLHAQNNPADEAYIKAMSTPDINQKAKMLKDYLAQYAGKGTTYENFANAYLCLLPYAGKTAKETIDYGEKALALGGLDDLTKCQVLIQISAVYSDQGQNLEKAKSYAQQVIQIGETNKGKESETDWSKIIGAGYLTLGQAQEKAKDLKSAVSSYIASYNMLKNVQIANTLAKLGKSLYDSKSYVEAERALKISCEALKDYGSCALYAHTLYKNGKKEEALKYFKQAYAKQKSGDIAYNIGIILAAQAKTNPTLSQEAIHYLLEASFLSPENSQKAMSLAESLFFTSNKDLKYNESVQEMAERNKKLEELTETFNKKFGEKDEEDLTDAEKKEMQTLLFSIEEEKKAIEKLKAQQEAAFAKFNQVIEETKKRLGIK